MPSHYEGFGVAIAEAMGCGACIITCDVGAVRTVVGDCGLYVPPGSPEKLAQAIKRALNDGVLRRTLQAAAQERASQLFTVDTKRTRLQRYLLELGIDAPPLGAPGGVVPSSVSPNHFATVLIFVLSMSRSRWRAHRPPDFQTSHTEEPPASGE